MKKNFQSILKIGGSLITAILLLASTISPVFAAGSFNKISPFNGATGLSLTPELSWTHSSYNWNYDICVDTIDNGECDTSWNSVGSNESYVFPSALSPLTTYYWQVRATTGSDKYADGVFWSFTTGDGSPGDFDKTSPADNAVGLSLTELTVSWGASADAVSYEVCVDGTPGTTCDTQWIDVGDTTGVVIPAEYITQYAGPLDTLYWHVRAVNTYGTTYSDGGSTAFFSATFGDGTPMAFNKTSPADESVDLSLTELAVSWNASVDAASYEVCVDTTDNDICNTEWVNVGDDTDIVIPAEYLSVYGSLNTAYYWQVRAVNTYGTTQADDGTFWLGTTGDGKPEDFGKTSPSNGASNVSLAPKLQWESATDAASYEVCVDTTDNGICDTEWVNVGDVTFVDVPFEAPYWDYVVPNTLFYWQVRAVNAYGTTEANGGTFWSGTTGNGYPEDFDKTDPSQSTKYDTITPTLEWEASKLATSYGICIDTINNDTCDTNVVNVGNATSYTVPWGVLTPDETYYWQVCAGNMYGETCSTGGGYDPSGSSNDTIWRRLRIDDDVPKSFEKESPADEATGLSLTELAVDWGNSNHLGHYEICVDTTDDGVCETEWLDVGTNSGVIVQAEYLSMYGSPNTTYYWQVRAVNDLAITYADGSNTSDWWEATTGDGSPMAFNKTSPTDESVDLSLTELAVSWGTSTDAASYEVCVDTTDNDICDTEWLDVGNVTNIVVPAEYLSVYGSPNTAYYWQVRAVNTYGTTEADGGTFWLGTTGDGKPEDFGKTSPSNGASNVSLAPTLQWESATDAASYEVCVDTTVGDTCDTGWVNVGDVTHVDVPFEAPYWDYVVPNTLFYWQVRAVNAYGTTEANGGTFWSGTTGNGYPEDFDKTAPHRSDHQYTFTPTLEWEASKLATAYKVCIDDTNDGACDTGWVNVGNATSYTVPSGVLTTANHDYYWQVRAENKYGETYSTGCNNYCSSGDYNRLQIGGSPGSFSKRNPSDGTEVDSSTTELRVRWYSSSHAVSYEVCVDDTPGTTCDTQWVDVGDITDITIPVEAIPDYILGIVTPNTTYYWQVRAVNLIGTTESSNGWWSIITGE